MMPQEEAFTNNVIDIESLPSLDDIEYHELSKEYFYARLLGTLITLGWFTVVYFVLAYILRDEIPLWARQTVPWILLVWWVFSLIRVYKTFKKKAFALRERDVHYKTGWIWRKQTTLPYNRIQHCELSSGPVDRLFGLTELHIFTAGGSQSDVTIPGLTKERGQRIKKMILDKIGSDEEE